MVTSIPTEASTKDITVAQEGSSTTEAAAVTEETSTTEEETTVVEDEETTTEEQREEMHDTPENPISEASTPPKPFVCPTPSGQFPNPENCHTFYMCSNGLKYLFVSWNVLRFLTHS